MHELVLASYPTAIPKEPLFVWHFLTKALFTRYIAAR